MLKNEYLLAKFGLDTAENEPSQVCPIPRHLMQRRQRALSRDLVEVAGAVLEVPVPSADRVDLILQRRLSTPAASRMRSHAQKTFR